MEVSGFSITVDVDEGDTFKYYLQQVLNKYHETQYPSMKVPQSKKYAFRVSDDAGKVVGGALLWVYWRWVDISLLALEERIRGHGLGKQLIQKIERKALEEGCTHIRVETFEHELSFYQKMGYRIVGHLEDYPEGYSYYWLRKDLM